MRRIFEAGMALQAQDRRLYFATFTAPGLNEHTVNGKKDGPKCPCTPPGGINAAEWNATAGKRFNKLVTYMRRLYGDVQYARAAEVQLRIEHGPDQGTLHFHVVVSVPGDRALWANRHEVARLRRLAIECGFGHSVKVDAIESGSSEVASYAAKQCSGYASKSCADRDHLPWLDRETGEIVTGARRYRPWSSSRRWGVTMASVRREQARWAAAQLLASEGPEAVRRAAAGPPPPPLPGANGGAPGAGAAGPLDPNTTNYTRVTRAVYPGARHSDSTSCERFTRDGRWGMPGEVNPGSGARQGRSGPPADGSDRIAAPGPRVGPLEREAAL